MDFKSARVTDSDGQLFDHHVVQLQLYSLMLEAAFPDDSGSRRSSKASSAWKCLGENEERTRS